ncbi:MAG: hypothetical protein COA47_01915 [Robiginitomaculum sp.]|nr:MAG: hypothetical protein COA47_01915 [Robiginitomaculum sp.]
MASSKFGSFFKKVWKDPLIHFLLLGGLLFAMFYLNGGAVANRDKGIHLSLAAQQHLADLFEITWQRAPTKDELSNLIAEQIKEEIYYREALALGLDENDTIVRRRLRQKLEFMHEDLSGNAEPNEVQLRHFFNTHLDRYKTDRVISFEQVLISTQTVHGTSDVATQALRALASGVSAGKISRSSLLPVSMRLETGRAISNVFGSDFLVGITEIGPGEWRGPIYSSFGSHLVKITLDQPSRPLSFANARTNVTTDFIRDRREAAAIRYYQDLRSQYRITVEKQP